jgi:hypothetical protein
MALSKRNGRVYGTSRDDLPAEIASHSRASGYEATQFRNALCQCGTDTFRLLVDDSEGAAVRQCASCSHEHPIGDSAEYLSEASLEECECPCGNSSLQITVGVALYTDSRDVRWLYIGCRCPVCTQMAVYAFWKNEYLDFTELLALV